MYAQKTKVSVKDSRLEIEDTLARYGVREKQFTDLEDRSMIQFKHKNRVIRFTLFLPSPNDKKFETSKTGRSLSNSGIRNAWDQACRTKWRALLLGIKAKLEIVQSGITTFEEEFMAHTVMPDGRTVAEHAIPRIAQSYAEQKNCDLLGFNGAPK